MLPLRYRDVQRLRQRDRPFATRSPPSAAAIPRRNAFPICLDFRYIVTYIDMHETQTHGRRRPSFHLARRFFGSSPPPSWQASPASSRRPQPWPALRLWRTPPPFPCDDRRAAAPRLRTHQDDRGTLWWQLLAEPWRDLSDAVLA